MEINDFTIRDYPELASAISNSFDVMSFLLRKTAAQSISLESYKKGILNVIAYDCFDTIRSAHKLVLMGSYEPAVKLLRSSFEGCLLLSVFGNFEEEAFELDKEKKILEKFLSEGKVKEINKKLKEADKKEREKFLFNLWLDTNDENNSTKKQILMNYFGPSIMITSTNTENKEIQEDKMAYHRLSQFSHPQFYGLISRLNQEPGKVRLGRFYDPKASLGCLKDIFKMIIRMSNNLRKSFDILDIDEIEFSKLDRMNKEYDKYV